MTADETNIQERQELEVYTPAVFTAGEWLAGKQDIITSLLEPFGGTTLEGIRKMPVKEIKTIRANVRAVINEIEDERKSIKKTYNAPLAAFEAQVKEIIEPAQRIEAALGEEVNAKEDEAKELKRQGIEQSYYDYAPALADVVPFERILDKRWLNKSYNAVKAVEEMYAIVDKIAHDWEALKGQADSLQFYQECEAEFFRTLDLSAALRLNAMRTEEQARINELKQQVEANKAAYEQQEEAEPEPTQQATEPSTEPEVVRTSYYIMIDLTEDEKAALLDFIKSNNIGTNRRIGRR